MSFDIQGAVNAGYSPQEITEFLSKNHPEFDVAGALKAGYSLPEIATQLNAPQTAPTEDPGLLKSGAAGLMSGVPLAETAVAGIQALSPDKTYEQAHQGLEDLKDKAWESHPVAYGAGKAAGIVGTGLAAPASLPGAIAVGAASGLDASPNIASMPSDALKGGAMGAAMGTVAEKMISPLISKLVPTVAKGAVGALGPGTKNVEEYLANREGVNAAIPATAAAEKLTGRLNDLGTAAGHLGSDARSLLNPEVFPGTVPPPPDIPIPRGRMVTIPGVGKAASDVLEPQNASPALDSVLGVMAPDAEGIGSRGTVVTPGGRDLADLLRGGNVFEPNGVPNTLKPLFTSIRHSLTENGIPTTSANAAAVNALDEQYQRLSQMAQANGGKLSEVDLKKVIADLQEMLHKNVFDNPDVSAAKGALAQLSGALNGMLKTSNPAYGEAMKPVSDLKGMIGDVKDTFRPDTNEAGSFIPSDATNSKMGNILNENKTNSQDVLSKFGDFTGFDFIKNANLDKVRQAFDNGGHSGQMLNAAGHIGGYGVGKLSGLPAGGLIGSLLGGFAAHAVDGGAIAKGILDLYLNSSEKMADAGVTQALQKYGPMLVKAAKQGGNQLAATHYVLSTSHPEYQALIQQVQQNNP